LGSETLAAALGVHVQQSGCPFGAVAEADAVVTGQVGAGLGGGDQVVGGHGVVGVGQANVYKVGAQAAVDLDGLIHGGLYVRIKSGDKVFLGQADAEPLDSAGQGG